MYKILIKNQVNELDWNIGIRNPTQLYTYTKVHADKNPMFIYANSSLGEFKWLIFLKRIFWVKTIEVVSEPNLSDWDLAKAILRDIIEKINPHSLSCYSITLAKFERDIFSELKFNKTFRFGSSLVDLTQTADGILASFHSKHRNVVRRAIKGGVVIDFDCTLDEIYPVIQETYKRSNKLPLPYHYLQNYLEKLGDNIQLIVAKKENLIQAVAIFLVSEKMTIYWHGGSINKPFIGASNLLQYEAMRFFKEKGIQLYDMGGLSLSKNKSDKGYNIDSFKERFGGERHIYYGGIKRRFSFLIYKRLLDLKKRFLGN